MPEVKNFLIVVNSGADKPYNQSAAYVIAFMAKHIHNIENVTIFYGPYGVSIVKKGELAKFKISSSIKELIAGQIEGLSPSDLPDDLAQLARYEKEKLSIDIASCGTYHVMEGFAKTIDDKSNIEDFINVLKLPEVMKALLAADKIHYL
jgi:predicted peroxiredoxin